ncbi:MAG: hypothetical protein ACOX2M_03785 [Fastidiosipilaceae bacterium]|jgi:hypothetical protein
MKLRKTIITTLMGALLFSAGCTNVVQPKMESEPERQSEAIRVIEEDVPYTTYNTGQLTYDLPSSWAKLDLNSDQNATGIQQEYYYGSGIPGDVSEGYVFASAMTYEFLNQEAVTNEDEAKESNQKMITALSESLITENEIECTILGTKALSYDFRIEEELAGYGKGFVLSSSEHMYVVNVLFPEENDPELEKVYELIISEIEAKSALIDYQEKQASIK